jgi:hypothetical protein
MRCGLIKPPFKRLRDHSGQQSDGDKPDPRGNVRLWEHRGLMSVSDALADAQEIGDVLSSQGGSGVYIGWPTQRCGMPIGDDCSNLYNQATKAIAVLQKERRLYTISLCDRR